MQNYIRRWAILIGSPGGCKDSSFLPGVKKDINSFHKYLCSPRGGSWYAHEIIELMDPTAEKVLAVTQMAAADYLLLYFSGHGCTDFQGNRLLSFRDNAFLSDIALVQGHCPRILLINDACRNFVGEGIGSIPLPEEEFFSFTGESSLIRQLFDECILASAPGKTIIHGTQSGEYSMDSSRGGYFTQSLLHVAGRMIVDEGYEMASIEQVLRHVPGVLRKRGSNQLPDIIYYSGALKVPFSIALPVTREVTAKGAAQDIAPAESTNWGGLLGLGLIAMAVYLSSR